MGREKLMVKNTSNEIFLKSKAAGMEEPSKLIVFNGMNILINSEALRGISL